MQVRYFSFNSGSLRIRYPLKGLSSHKVNASIHTMLLRRTLCLFPISNNFLEKYTKTVVEPRDNSAFCFIPLKRETSSNETPGHWCSMINFRKAVTAIVAEAISLSGAILIIVGTGEMSSERPAICNKGTLEAEGRGSENRRHEPTCK